jgi:peptidoglycan/LPS O-acetylase OafA/YrhL
MAPLSVLPVLIALFTAVATTSIIVKFSRSRCLAVAGRNESIDGLRGFLAFFVFLHHSAVWYFYIRSDKWEVPPSNLYTHLGESSVAFFFMITGFLFFSKLLNGRKNEVDFGRLFISRFMRLTPLFVFVVLITFMIVAVISNGKLQEPLPKLLLNAIRWLGFTFTGGPDINGVKHTWVIVAEVTWSLPYEWFFYFSLPLFAFLLRIKTPLPYLIAGIVFLSCCLVVWRPQLYHLFSFLGGIIAAGLVRINGFEKFSKCNIASILIISLVSTAIFIYPSAYELVPLLLLAAAFSLIAGGNSLWGLLVNQVAKIMGEMAYSIYLLHGIILFFTFNFLIGLHDARLYSPTQHWMIVVALTPVLILTSHFTYQLIELPAMQNTNAVTNWFRSPKPAMTEAITKL